MTENRVPGEWACTWRDDYPHFIPDLPNRGIWGVTLCGFVMRPNVRFWTKAEAEQHWGKACPKCHVRLQQLVRGE